MDEKEVEEIEKETEETEEVKKEAVEKQIEEAEKETKTTDTQLIEALKEEVYLEEEKEEKERATKPTFPIATKVYSLLNYSLPLLILSLLFSILSVFCIVLTEFIAKEHNLVRWVIKGLSIILVILISIISAFLIYKIATRDSRKNSLMTLREHW